MATYAELYGLFSNASLANRAEVACVVAAEAIRNENPATANHANRLLWAKRVFQGPAGVRNEMLMALLAGNAGLTVDVLTTVTDANLQTAVNNAVNVFADGAA